MRDQMGFEIQTERCPMRRSLLAAAVAASSLVLASCAMPADDPNWDPEAAAQAIEDELDPEAAAAAAASEQAYATAFDAPTSIGVDAPLAATPAAGAVIVSLSDGTEFDGGLQASMAEAAQTLGWTLETVTVDLADPASIATAFDEALAATPAGIHIQGSMADALAANLPAAETAGVPVVCTGCSTDAVPGVTDSSIDGTEQNRVWGDILASYVVENQYDGEDAGVQVFALPGGAATDFNLQFSTALLDQCRNCSATESTIDPTFTDLTDPVAVADLVVMDMSTALGAWALLDSGSLSAGVVDTLASDPTLLSPAVVVGRGASPADIASLQALGGAGPTGPAAGADVAADDAAAEGEGADQAAADDAAELEGVEGDFGGDLGGRTPEEAAALQAWIGVSQPVMGWRIIDQFARIIGGEAPATGPLPSQLLTGGTVADAVLDENGGYLGIADYKEQFAALWGIQ